MVLFSLYSKTVLDLKQADDVCLTQRVFAVRVLAQDLQD